MKLLALAIITLACASCDGSLTSDSGRYELIELANGVVHKLDTTTGKSDIFFSPFGTPKIEANTLYEDADGTTYEYQGDGKLRKLSEEEVMEVLLKKYEG